MTTKVQQRWIRAPHIHHQYQCYSSEKEFISLHKLEFPMDRMLELQTIESMKKMMMIQEQIFKQQVQELHRVYNVQKKLMQELENRLITKRQTKAKTVTIINSSMFSVWHHQTAVPTETGTGTGHSFQGFITRDNPKECCSGESSRILMPPESTSNIYNYHLSEDHHHHQKDLKAIGGEENDVEVELTLGIGQSAREKRLKNDYDEHQSNDQVQELGFCSRKTNNGEASSSINDSSSSACHENTRRHWLLQDLSLNRT